MWKARLEYLERWATHYRYTAQMYLLPAYAMDLLLISILQVTSQ